MVPVDFIPHVVVRRRSEHISKTRPHELPPRLAGNSQLRCLERQKVQDRIYSLPGGGLVQSSDGDNRQNCKKLALTRDEAASMLSICVKTLDRLANKGQIRSIKVFRRRIFAFDDIITWLQTNASCAKHTPAATSPESPLPLTVNRQEAARLLSLGVRLFDRVVASGQIAKIQITRKLIYRTSDLVHWLQNQPGDYGNV